MFSHVERSFCCIQDAWKLPIFIQGVAFFFGRHTCKQGEERPYLRKSNRVVTKPFPYIVGVCRNFRLFSEEGLNRERVLFRRGRFVLLYILLVGLLGCLFISFQFLCTDVVVARPALVHLIDKFGYINIYCGGGGWRGGEDDAQQEKWREGDQVYKGLDPPSGRTVSHEQSPKKSESLSWGSKGNINFTSKTSTRGLVSEFLNLQLWNSHENTRSVSSKTWQGSSSTSNMYPLQIESCDTPRDTARRGERACGRNPT